MSHSLYLYPSCPLSDETLKRLLDSLQHRGFLDANDADGTLLPGARLMDFITYLGCSPALSSGGVEAALRLHRFDAPRWLGGDAIDRQRFPGCGHAIEQGSALLQAGDPWQCPQCGQQGRLQDIAWRKSAARADSFIEIAPIFPREAVPADALLELLKKGSDCDWQWFYSRSNL